MNVQKTETCWLWTGTLHRSGHGVVAQNTWRRFAHRYAWELANGPIPDGISVLHTCDVRNCIRNDEPGIYVVNGVGLVRQGHLFLGTQADNIADMMQKGRHALGEATGLAKVTEDDVRLMHSMRDEGRLLREICDVFGLSIQQVSRIISGTNWKHVA